MKRTLNALCLSALIVSVAACSSTNRRSDSESAQGQSGSQDQGSMTSGEAGSAGGMENTQDSGSASSSTSGSGSEDMSGTTQGTSGSESQGDQAGTAGSSGSTGSSTSGSNSSGSNSQSMTPSRMANEMAVNQLHHINQKEIQLAKMAQEKAQSQEVKNMAQQILRDHEQLDSQLQAQASTSGLKLQAFSPATHEKATMESLGQLSGSQFDQAFLMQMKHGHKDAQADLKMTRRSVKDQAVRGLIDAALPKIGQHARMVNQQAGMIGSSHDQATSSEQPSSSEQAGTVGSETTSSEEASAPTTDEAATSGSSSESVGDPMSSDSATDTSSSQ